MGGSASLSKRKSSKRKRDKKKKSRRKELKRRSHKYDSSSSSSLDDEADRGRRKNKSRKPRHDTSLSSSSSQDLSISSDSDSLSTHDRRRKHSKARRLRVASKSRKKKDRKRFTSTSSDSDVGNAKKRKRVGRDDKPEKKSSKKRSRKHLSSSPSSDSETCSMGSHSDGERVKPMAMELGRDHDHGAGLNDEDWAITRVDNPRRLKSVIAVVNQSHDEENNRWETDPHKEVIVYDREDYPSPKSLDSYEGGSKMESDDNSQGASSKQVCIENVADAEATEPGTGDCKSNVENKGVTVAGLGGDNLESILRQKALENLRKFRGKLSVGPKSNESDGVLDKSLEQDSSSAREIDRIEPSLKKDFLQFNEVKKSRDCERTEAEQIAYGGLLGCPNEDKDLSSQPVLSKHDEPRDDTSVALANTSGGLVTADDSTVNQQNEDTDGSQFEQRTMSVMRGGEMVQVSYKVYIPKKSPALARRQLRR